MSFLKKPNKVRKTHPYVIIVNFSKDIPASQWGGICLALEKSVLPHNARCLADPDKTGRNEIHFCFLTEEEAIRFYNQFITSIQEDYKDLTYELYK